MNSLSERQQKILAFVISHVDEKGYPPSIREIGHEVDISSTSVVKYNLNKLEELELLNREKEVSRGISINWSHFHSMDSTKIFAEQILNDPNLQAVMSKNGSNGWLPNGQSQLTGTPTQDGTPYAGRLIRLPVLGRIAAGEPIAVQPREQANPEEWLDLAEGMFMPGKLGHPDSLYALRVQGDSMIDANVMDGDLVILRHQERAENGEMVAAWIEEDEETTLKYWRLQDSQVHLQPANPHYETIVRDANKVRVQGSVVSVIRYMH